MVLVPLIAKLLAVFSLAFSASAADVRGKVQWNDMCPGIAQLGPSTVILDNGELFGGVTADGSFLISDVPPGVYILQVQSHDYVFDQLRIDVSAESDPEARTYVPGTPLNPPSPIPLHYPISLTPRQKNVYFVPPASFNILAMLNNPMMLMMVFGGGLMLGMPYLMKNMDPEVMEDFKGQQAKIANLQNAMQTGDLKSGFSALMSGDDPAPAPKLSPAASSPKNRNKNKKR